MIKYDPVTNQLNSNMIYNVTFRLPGVIDLNWSFTSRYNPYFSTVKMVRETAGAAINDITDSTVATAIYVASCLCNDIILGDVSVIGDEAIASQLAINSMYVREQTKQEFTKYTAAYTLLNQLTAEYVTRGETESKKLGNLAIENRSSNNVDLSPMLSYLQKMITYWENKLRNEAKGGKSIASAVRSINKASYPLGSRVF